MSEKMRRETRLNKMLKKGMILLILVSLTVYSKPLSYTRAYFTDQVSSGGQEGARSAKSDIRLYFNVHQLNNVNIDLNLDGNSLLIIMRLPDGDGFGPQDVIVDQLNLFLGGNRIDVDKLDILSNDLELRLKVNTNDLLNFNQDEVLKLDISGKGKGQGSSGLGERFIFEAWAQLEPPPAPPLLPVPQPLLPPVIKDNTEILEVIPPLVVDDRKELEAVEEIPVVESGDPSSLENEGQAESSDSHLAEAVSQEEDN